MRVLDLFSAAAGGWTLGAHRAGFETAAACEIDPVRRAIYAQNNPGVKLYDDVRTLTADKLRGDLGFLPDAIFGSPPCQDISSANTKGKGVDGARSGLFFEAVRLVGECRPRWVALENSAFVRTRGYDRIADALEAVGYPCEPFVVGADDLGAPHKRERAWLLAFDPEGVRLGRGRTWGRGPEGVSPTSAQEDAADLPSLGRGPWRARRSDPGVAREQDQLGARQENADTDRHAGRLRPSVPDADRDIVAEQLAALEQLVGPAVHTWNGGAARHLRMAHALSPRLALIRVPDHKFPGATITAAKACVAAYGDAVLPQIPEAICRAIIRVENALACLFDQEAA